MMIRVDIFVHKRIREMDGTGRPNSTPVNENKHKQFQMQLTNDNSGRRLQLINITAVMEIITRTCPPRKDGLKFTARNTPRIKCGITANRNGNTRSTVAFNFQTKRIILYTNVHYMKP